MILLALGLAFATPGHEAWQAGGCATCHDVPGQAEEPRATSCAGCHDWIRATAADPARRERALAAFPLWERYERNVVSYLDVPSLEAAMARLEPEWVAAYLEDPHDLRPGLPETMPRFDLDEAQVSLIASAFGPEPVPATAAVDPANAARGESLFASRGCVACHTFGTLHPGPGLPSAPDLAVTRHRMDPDVVAAWIADPQSVSAAATMPAFGLPADEVLALRDYLFVADPAGQVPEPVASVPVAVDRPVGWAEVQERVFGRVCVHCHMDPEANGGRGGPGNQGGYGWAATGIELETAAGVAAVADRIPAVLLRRRDEARRDVLAPGEAPADLDRHPTPGMPLGLPALSDEEIGLVLAWIEQGALGS